MDRDDRRAGQRERQRVLEVAERGAERRGAAAAASAPSAAPATSVPSSHGLDSLGDELGVPRDGGEPKAGRRRERRQLAQEVEHVRLVARALAAEHVRVDDDERRHASSRQTRSTRRRPRAHEYVRARSSPSARSSSRRDDGLLDPGRDRLDVERVDEHGRAAGDLLGRAAAARHDGRAARHRLEHRDAEALVQRREDERSARRGRARPAPRRRPRRPSRASRRRPSRARRRRAARRRPARRPRRSGARFLRGSSVATAST